MSRALRALLQVDKTNSTAIRPGSAPGLMHPQLRAGLLLGGLLMFTIAACASSTDGVHAGTDRAKALFTDAYQGIHDYYLEPVTVQTLALSGLHKLDASDDSLVIRDDGQVVDLLSHGAEIDRMAEPAVDDAGGWARVTAAAIAAARAHEPQYANATDEQLYQRVFSGIIEKLDRFTRYAGLDAARDQRASRDGYVGVGITIDNTGPKPRLSAVVADSPARTAGLMVDDRLLAIDSRPVTNLPLDRITEMLRGDVGTKLNLTVERPSQERTLTVRLMRGLVVLPTVTSERDGAIAIFRVASFNHNTAASLAAELDAQLGPNDSKGVKGIVLDLRGDPGGLLDQAVEVARIFVDHGAIVSTRGRHAGADQYYEANEKDRARGLPMAVLVNGGTASSSEIVAAALQDKGRAVVIGSASYGKGTVQRVLTLANDGELTLTWARLVTPAGYILHQHGVVPTFCTSTAANKQEPGKTEAAKPEVTKPEDDAVRVAAILAHGLHPTPGIESEPRAALSDADWAQLRSSCPCQTADSPIDLQVAKEVLGSPSLYAQALT